MEKKKPVRLTKEEWAVAGDLWRTGDYTLAQLSKKFRGIEPTYLSKQFSKLGIVRGSLRAEIERRVSEEIEKRAVASASEKAEKLQSTLDDAYKWVEGIGKLNMLLLAEAAKPENRTRVGAYLEDNIKAFKAINIAAQTCQTIRQERLMALGVRDYEYEAAEDLPTLPITEMTAEEIAIVQSGQDLLEFGPGEEDGEFEDMDGEA